MLSLVKILVRLVLVINCYSLRARQIHPLEWRAWRLASEWQVSHLSWDVSGFPAQLCSVTTSWLCHILLVPSACLFCLFIFMSPGHTVGAVDCLWWEGKCPGALSSCQDCWRPSTMDSHFPLPPVSCSFSLCNFKGTVWLGGESCWWGCAGLGG